MSVVQAGALGDGAGVGRERDEPDAVEVVGEVAPGISACDLGGADQ
ncbi:MAG: hypothetical protein WD400_00750 [Pontimonas sp.]